ncbi:MAG TPA: FHA domain-containing protein [Thermoguttaceae bacterium]|nr:FHA domain-containing protein [Thermoguttaceae bacterium]
MALVTLRVLDGADRGQVFDNLPTPVTIGREEGNLVQLNDERISRFHLKIQEDEGRLVLTDLESTNGTRVNGEAVQLWILRAGDLISVGRTLLLCGSEDEIARRLAGLRGVDTTEGATMDIEEVDESAPSVSLDFELNWTDEPGAQSMLHTLLPPELPEGLSLGQNAQLSELLQYMHLRLRGLIESAAVSRKTDEATMPQRRWQDLLDLEARLGRYLRSIGEPH